MHDASTIAPVEDKYFPTPQLMHELPLDGLYFPARQDTHDAKSAEFSCPTAHDTQAEEEIEPKFAFAFPTGQQAHSDGVFAYFPGAHDAQSEALSCALAVRESSYIVFPLSQRMQALNPANSAYLPTAQTEQTVALGLKENLPISQSMHAKADDEPELAFALPGLQSVQGPPTPSWLYLPTTQGVQFAAEVEPTLAVVFPTTHAVH